MPIQFTDTDGVLKDMSAQQEAEFLAAQAADQPTPAQVAEAARVAAIDADIRADSQLAAYKAMTWATWSDTFDAWTTAQRWAALKRLAFILFRRVL